MASLSHRHPVVLTLGIAVMLVGALNPWPAHAQSAGVTIQNFAFAPATLTVPVGTTVTWTNRDSVAHTSTSDTGVWNSGMINPGGSYSYRFNQPGMYPYHCMIHPNMHGTIVVQVAGGQTGGQPATGALAVTVTPSTVTVGSTAVVSGTGFTPRNWTFVVWQRPDRTVGGIWLVTSSAGTFALRLGFAPLHGTGTEFVSAFDFATRRWSPAAAVSVVPGPVVTTPTLSASPNPVAKGGATTITGTGFAPFTGVVVRWTRPDGTRAAIQVVTNGAGSFAFRLVADLRHGCGPRTFVAIVPATGMTAAPLTLAETC